MEARATFVGARGSKTYVAAVLVVVALAVAAVGGYLVAGLVGSKAAASNHVVPAANPPAYYPMPDVTRAVQGQPAAVPDWILQEITPASPAPRLSQDSREFIAQYAQPSSSDTSGRVYDAIPTVPGSEYEVAP